MLIHLFITLLILAFLFRLILRVIFRPFRHNRFYGGWNGYNGYGYNPYRYGCRRHHRLLGGLLPIVALVALDRFFTRRF
jgi:hypothetical protein